MAEHQAAHGGYPAGQRRRAGGRGRRRPPARVGVDRPRVEGALDPGGVEPRGEAVVGLGQGAADHDRPPVGALDRAVGGAEQRRVLADGPPRLEERVLVGLVPDLPAGDPRPVALDQVGQRVAVGGRIAGGVALHVAIPPPAAAALAQLRRSGRGPAGRAHERQQHAHPARPGPVDGRVEAAHVPALAPAAGVLLQRRPAHVDAHQARTGGGRRVEVASGLVLADPRPQRVDLDPHARRRRAGRCPRRGPGPPRGSRRAGRRERDARGETPTAASGERTFPRPSAFHHLSLSRSTVGSCGCRSRWCSSRTRGSAAPSARWSCCSGRSARPGSIGSSCSRTDRRAIAWRGRRRAGRRPGGPSRGVAPRRVAAAARARRPAARPRARQRRQGGPGGGVGAVGHRRPGRLGQARLQLGRVARWRRWPGAARRWWASPARSSSSCGGPSPGPAAAGAVRRAERGPLPVDRDEAAARLRRRSR